MPPHLAWARLGARQLDLAFASARVINTRLARAAACDLRALAPADRAEFSRMVTEKIAAGAESGQAATLGMLAWQVGLIRAGIGMTSTPWWLNATPVAIWWKAISTFLALTTRHAPRVATRALAPIARRAHANDRRLARTGRPRAHR